MAIIPPPSSAALEPEREPGAAAPLPGGGPPRAMAHHPREQRAAQVFHDKNWISDRDSPTFLFCFIFGSYHARGTAAGAHAPSQHAALRPPAAPLDDGAAPGHAGALGRGPPLREVLLVSALLSPPPPSPPASWAAAVLHAASQPASQPVS
jgi:hypothetical protein